MGYELLRDFFKYRDCKTVYILKNLHAGGFRFLMQYLSIFIQSFANEYT